MVKQERTYHENARPSDTNQSEFSALIRHFSLSHPLEGMKVSAFLLATHSPITTYNSPLPYCPEL